MTQQSPQRGVAMYRVATIVIFTVRFLIAGGATIGMYFAGQNGGF